MNYICRECGQIIDDIAMVTTDDLEHFHVL